MRDEHVRYLVENPGELGVGPQIGGKFGFVDRADPGRKRIWSGRPPTQPDGRRFRTLHLAATGGARGLGDTVEVNVEGGSGMGGRVLRRFRVGAGLSASLRLGDFEHVHVNTGPGGMTSGMQLYFVWTMDCFEQPSPLYDYLDYPVANTLTLLPEGCEGLTPQAACTITFNIAELGATFPVAAAAGQRVDAQWGAFQANNVNRFLLKMRGI